MEVENDNISSSFAFLSLTKTISEALNFQGHYAVDKWDSNNRE